MAQFFVGSHVEGICSSVAALVISLFYCSLLRRRLKLKRTKKTRETRKYCLGLPVLCKPEARETNFRRGVSRASGSHNTGSPSPLFSRFSRFLRFFSI